MRKKQITLYLNPKIYKKFRNKCKRQGFVVSRLIEKFMEVWISMPQAKKDVKRLLRELSFD